MSKALSATGLPKNVQLALVKRGMTVSEIARQLGKSKSTISLILRGKLQARDTAHQAAKLLGLKVSDFTVLGPGKKRTTARRRVIIVDQYEKGSREALLYATAPPPRCTSEDVDALLDSISAGRISPDYNKTPFD